MFILAAPVTANSISLVPLNATSAAHPPVVPDLPKSVLDWSTAFKKTKPVTLKHILSLTAPLAALPPVLTPITVASKPWKELVELLAIIVLEASPFTKRLVAEAFVVVPVKVIVELWALPLPAPLKPPPPITTSPSLSASP